jgi:hypothetical protein
MLGIYKKIIFYVKRFILVSNLDRPTFDPKLNSEFNRLTILAIFKHISLERASLMEM